MLAEPTVPTRWLVDLESPTAPPPPEPVTVPGRPRRDGLASLLAFAGALALVLVFALRGGSYDIVVRQEHGLVIWWVLALGIGTGLLPRARPPLAVLVLLGAFAAYVGWTALSLTWTESAEQTTAALVRALDYLGLVALIACVLDRRTWRAAAAGLGFGSLLVCVLAVASRLDPSAFPVDQAARAFNTDRLDYPFGYWNAVGAWGSMSAALGLAWSAHDGSRLRRSIALALVPVAALTTYLTYSRAGAAAIVLAALAVIAFSRNRLTAALHTAAAAGAAALAILAVRGAPQIAHATGGQGAGGVLAALVFGGAGCAVIAALTRSRRVDGARVPRRAARRLGVAATLVALLAAAGFGPQLASHAWHSFKTTGTAPAAAANPTARLSSLSGTRYNLWRVAIDGFTAHPVTGTGAGTYEFWWNRHARDAEFVINAHSLWLENMEELGAPGLLLIIAVAGSALGVAIAARRRSRRSASAGATAAVLAAFTVYLVCASVDWMWQSTAVTVLALAGIGIAGARLSERPLRLRWAVRGALALVAIAAAALQLPGLVATTAIRHSQSAERAGNTAAALSWAREAVSAEPWAASGYEQRALVLESEGRYRAAAADERRAVDNERTDFTHWLVLARIQTERGLVRQALSDYDQARRLRPLAQVFQLPPAAGVQASAKSYPVRR
jgi:hypothetical protein